MKARVFVVEESRDGGERWEAKALERRMDGVFGMLQAFRQLAKEQDWQFMYRLATYVRDEASVTKPKKNGANKGSKKR